MKHLSHHYRRVLLILILSNWVLGKLKELLCIYIYGQRGSKVYPLSLWESSNLCWQAWCWAAGRGRSTTLVLPPVINITETTSCAGRRQEWPRYVATTIKTSLSPHGPSLLLALPIIPILNIPCCSIVTGLFCFSANFMSVKQWMDVFTMLKLKSTKLSVSLSPCSSPWLPCTPSCRWCWRSPSTASSPPRSSANSGSRTRRAVQAAGCRVVTAGTTSTAGSSLGIAPGWTHSSRWRLSDWLSSLHLGFSCAK